MSDKVIISFPDGRKKEVKLPKYGEVTLIVRNGKVADIETKLKEKIC
ncbi:DUF2292 domain-containing protein [Vagococcus acidifermentans]|nr:DUF2292 domain-containing protein [Vagococcus acidifermentans]